ncbi:MAG: hypothetical protein Q9212_004800 [Teloschistes hypoglaucus]
MDSEQGGSPHVPPPSTYSQPLPENKNTVYVEYLSSIIHERPEYNEFGSWLANNAKREGAVGSTADVYVHDTLCDNTQLPRTSFKAGEDSAVRLLEHTLSNQPVGLRSRLVLIGLQRRKTVDQRILNVLRLKLGIEPPYFWSVLAWRDEGFLSHCHQEMLKARYMTLQQLKHYGPSMVSNVSVTVVAFGEAHLPSIDRSHSPSLWLESMISTLRHHSYSPRIKHDSTGMRLDLLESFSCMLLAKQTTSSKDDLFHCVLLMRVIYIADFCQLVADSRPDDWENVEWPDWLELRTELDRFQSDIRAFTRYLKEDSVQTDLQQRLEKIREDEEDLCAEAQALESAIRDTLQVNSGIKSLEESRVSIEEGKRIKLLTTLAFIFIPTSLASSIFGMNVQEINSTGKPIWTFVLTAVLLTSAAVVSWFISFLIQGSSRRDKRRFHSPRKRRLELAWWLCKNPFRWQQMPRGTLLGVLTDNRFGNEWAIYQVDLRRTTQQA